MMCDDVIALMADGMWASVFLCSRNFGGGVVNVKYCKYQKT